MKLCEFLSLSEDEQFNSIWFLGSHIDNFIKDNLAINLYLINYFYCEVNYYIETNNYFPFYNRLCPERKVYFEHRFKEFIGNYQFVGKEIVITEQMQMLIAGTYVMLTFGMRNYLIRLFYKIIISQSSYCSTVNKEYHKGEFNP